MTNSIKICTYFSDFFEVHPSVLDSYGALNISLINDLPLFIDPFLLFCSENEKYKQLHDGMMEYLIFLKDKSVREQVNRGLLQSWYMFGEIKQTWLGFSKVGNTGRGLGWSFADKMNVNLKNIFSGFGSEKITKSSHLEKICLIEKGVGADSISDYTTNLIVGYLAEYTETFAKEHLDAKYCKRVAVAKSYFDYKTETWRSKNFYLPYYKDDYVLLTPKDLLAQTKTWINNQDLEKQFEQIPKMVGNEELRATINNYFSKQLPNRTKINKKGQKVDIPPSKQERSSAINATLRMFPQLFDYYIKLKEENGDQALSISSEEVQFVEDIFIQRLSEMSSELNSSSNFYTSTGSSFEEALKRLSYLKTFIEDQDGYRFFYVGGKPVQREADIQLMYKLVWFSSVMDVNAEVNNGRGPVDFIVSYGGHNKSLVEFKLASNTQLKKNLENQVEIYQKASKAQHKIKAILYFTKAELEKTTRILKDLELENDKSVVLIDARDDNKQSASKATSH